MQDRVIVTLGNSYSRITGLSQDEMYALRKLLSYNVDFATARFIPNPANRVKYCIDAKGNFGTGLLYRVLGFCIDNDLDIKVEDRTSKDDPVIVFKRAFKSTFNVNPYPDQAIAVKMAIERGRGVISMPTGTGKSMVISMLLAKNKLKTLIVVPTVELKHQLSNTLSECLNSVKDITVENIDSTALKKAGDYDCLIIDEAHHVAAKTYHKLNKTAWSNIRHRYFFTATPFRNNSEETLLFESIAGEIIFELCYFEAVAKAYIVPVEAYYYEIPKVKTDAFTYAQVYNELIVNNEFRNNLIALLLLRFNADKKATLCLVKEIKHGEILSDLTGIPFVNGQDVESRQYIQDFNQGKIKCLIGTSGVLSEGVDTKPAEIVIVADLGKAKSQLMQKIGRVVRNYPGKESGKVIIFSDKSHKFLLRHFKEQCKIINEQYNTNPIKLEIE